jgi:hypothetical protein
MGNGMGNRNGVFDSTHKNIFESDIFPANRSAVGVFATIVIRNTKFKGYQLWKNINFFKSLYRPSEVPNGVRKFSKLLDYGG